jgi:Na+/H+-dicarboxylate symporter
MALMRWGLYAAAALAVIAGWTAVESGHSIEAAATRAVIAFMALAFGAYIIGLVVVTAPPPESELTDEQHEDDSASDGRAPVDLAEAREARERATDQRAA